MKKSLLVTLTMVFMLTVAGTAFAANPFELVPTDNWAYASIDSLAKAGIYAGYNDVHFQKDQTLTRNQIATLVAKAMANKNVTADQKAAIDKLAAEYKTELEAIGVKSDTADKGIAFSGYNRLRYTTRSGGSKGHAFTNKVELDVTGKINDAWTFNMSYEDLKSFYTDADITSDTSGPTYDNPVTTINASGPLAGGTLTVGRFNNTFGTGIIYDDYLTGVKYEFGNKLKTKLVYASTDFNSTNSALVDYLTKLNKATSIEFAYDVNDKTSLAGSLQHWAPKYASVDSMNAVDFGVTTKLSDKYSAYADFSKTNADAGKAYYLDIKYKGANKSIAGSYGIWLDYSYFEKNSALDSGFWNVYFAGTKAVILGVDYVPAKNIKWTNVVASYKPLSDTAFTSWNGKSVTWFRSQMFLYF